MAWSTLSRFRFWWWLIGLGVVAFLVNYFTDLNGSVVAGYVGATTILFWILLKIAKYWPSRSETSSGREVFEPGLIDAISATVRWGGISMNKIHRFYAKTPVPRMVDGVSVIVLGMTGMGKTTFVKSLMLDWDYSQAVVAHTISKAGKPNDWVEFFLSIGRDVSVISSRGSDVRWGVFEDFDGNAADMLSIAEGIYQASDDLVETGYSKSAKMLLAGGLAVCYERYGDFARLDDVMFLDRDESLHSLIDDIWELDGYRNLKAAAGNIDKQAYEPIYSDISPKLVPLFESDICNESLPKISLRQEFADPSRVIVLDNVKSDRYARPFWRFLLESAVDFASQSRAAQQFLFDEIDKLPRIANLGDLVSAGRDDEWPSVGIIVAQDRHQLNITYGSERAGSIWSNSPNRVCFKSGDGETRDLVLETIGKMELEGGSVSKPKQGIGTDTNNRTILREKELKYPITTGEMQDMETGDVVIHTEHGWWFGNVAEADLPEIPDEGEHVGDPAEDGGMSRIEKAAQPPTEHTYGDSFPTTEGPDLTRTGKDLMCRGR